MKKFIICALIACSAIAVTITSCDKYEDGPKFSLLTKKARLCGDWTLEKYTRNDSDVTTLVQTGYGSTWEWQIEKDGSYKQTGNVNDNGTWELGEDKDDVTFTSSATGSIPVAYRILKLKSKSLWLRKTNSNGTFDIIELKQ
jgi:hypothetical protein